MGWSFYFSNIQFENCPRDTVCFVYYLADSKNWRLKIVWCPQIQEHWICQISPEHFWTKKVILLSECIYSLLSCIPIPSEHLCLYGLPYAYRVQNIWAHATSSISFTTTFQISRLSIQGGMTPLRTLCPSNHPRVFRALRFSFFCIGTLNECGTLILLWVALQLWLVILSGPPFAWAVRIQHLLLRCAFSSYH